METTKFELADYLDSKEMIAEYLNTVLMDLLQVDKSKKLRNY